MRCNRQLWAPLCCGALARGIAAVLALSFHARDDYFHVLAPALGWLRNPAFDWDHSDLPGAGIRSHLLPRCVWLLLRLFNALDITSAPSQLRGLYLMMGLYSLLLVPAMYYAARHLFADTPHIARRAAWMGALFFPFPYAGTRLLIEALAMPPLLFAVAFCDSKRLRTVFVAGAALSLACWWRYQTAAVLIGVVPWLWHQRGVRQVAVWLSGAAAVLGLQGLFDVATTGDFLGPLIRNVLFNLHPPAHLSRSTPWGYLAFWLLLTLPPATIWLAPAMWRAAQRAGGVSWALAAFVGVHSCIAHKEDRFMLPALPLMALLLAAAPSFLKNPWPGHWPALRVYCGAVCAFALALAISSQSQANLRDAMLLLHNDSDARAVVSLGPELQTYFLNRSDVPTAHMSRPDAAALQQALGELAAAGRGANRFVAYQTDRQVVEVMVRLAGYACEPPQQISGWWFDRLLRRLNPRRNRRRGSILVYRCETPTAATAFASFAAFHSAYTVAAQPTVNLRSCNAPERQQPPNSGREASD